MKYSYKHTINIGETDCCRRLKLSSIMNQMQIAANFNSIQLGRGGNALFELGMGWILSRIRIEILRLPFMDEEVTISTWALQPKSVEYLREYEITDSEGNILIRASSRWCILSLQSKKLVRSEEINYLKELTETRKATDVPLKKIVCNKEMVYSHEDITRLSALDLNGHMNNTFYADKAIDCLTMDEFKGFNFSAVQLDYISQVYMGDTLKLYRADCDNGDIIIKGEDNSLVAFMCRFEK